MTRIYFVTLGTAIVMGIVMGILVMSLAKPVVLVGIVTGLVIANAGRLVKLAVMGRTDNAI